MSHKTAIEISKDEIKKEFQLERMILFSDAVFAIVITLMAIEIKIPEVDGRIQSDVLLHELRHLLPVIAAYVVSFFFIGVIWYQHLKIFSLVKDYDKGLVVRNLVLLFFIGLFPFSASIITKTKGTSIAFFIYLGVILCCIISQFILQHYILIKRPALRVNTDLQEHLSELRKKKIMVIAFSFVFLLCAFTFTFVKDAEIRSLTPVCILPVVIVYRILARKKK
jgi:uncharacterized membrane protein